MNDMRFACTVKFATLLLVLFTARTNVSAQSTVTLADGAVHTHAFASEPGRDTLLWLRARIVLDDGELPGAHALGIKLNGELLTPGTVRLLNGKALVYDGPRTVELSQETSGVDGMPTDVGELDEPVLAEGENALFDAPDAASTNAAAEVDWTTLPLPTPDREAITAFDAASVRWYLKADSDDIAFNDRDRTSPYGLADPASAAMPGQDMMARAARRSHFYEYLFLVPGARLRGDNTLELSAVLPDRLRGRSVAIDLKTQSVGAGFVLFKRPWMEFIYPWQAPALDDAINLQTGLVVHACAGEYEPTSFSLYSLTGLTGLTVRVSALQGDAGQKTIPAEQVAIYRLDSVIGGGMPFPWNRGTLSPELLKPQPGGGLLLHAGCTQPYQLDIRVPDGQPAGSYAGVVSVTTAHGTLCEIPLRLQVYPFALAPARQKYWMWRLQWSPDWQPDNVACLKDIREHGFSGLVRTGGARFRVAIDRGGAVRVDDAEIRKFCEVMDRVGLERRLSDTGIAPALATAAAAHAGLQLPLIGETLPDLEGYLFRQIEMASLKADAQAARDAIRPDDLLADAAAGGALNLEEDAPQNARAKQKATLHAEAARQAKDYYAVINPLIVEGFRQVKRSADELSMEYYVFPVDEPCGTPWRRAWTKYVSTLAHEAGLKVWSTHNNVRGWDSGIDVSCAGSAITHCYSQMAIRSGTLTVDISGIPLLPTIGRMRQGAGYGFAGRIDEVRIYNRALTEAELLRQREQPAEEGLLAYYPMDEGSGDTAADTSGHGYDARLQGLSWVEGKHGRALMFTNGVSDQLSIPHKGKPGSGWSISMWVNGGGCTFGKGYEFYCQRGTQLIIRPPDKEMQVLNFGQGMEAGFWTHVTIALDPSNKVWRAYLHDADQREWYRKNIDWNYIQVRGRWNPWGRYQTGYMAWYQRYLDNVTCFGYDWNWGSTYLVYPEGGNRAFNSPNTPWYGTLGWTAVREGIDDGRYIHTLYQAEKRRAGGDDEAAWEAVKAALHPVSEYDWMAIQHCYTTFGGFDPMRRRIAERIGN